MMNIQKELQQFSAGEADMRFNNVDVAPETIRAIMINEVVPSSRRRISMGSQIPRICQQQFRCSEKQG